MAKTDQKRKRDVINCAACKQPTVTRQFIRWRNRRWCYDCCTTLGERHGYKTLRRYLRRAYERQGIEIPETKKSEVTIDASWKNKSAEELEPKFNIGDRVRVLDRRGSYYTYNASGEVEKTTVQGWSSVGIVTQRTLGRTRLTESEWSGMTLQQKRQASAFDSWQYIVTEFEGEPPAEELHDTYLLHRHRELAPHETMQHVSRYHSLLKPAVADDELLEDQHGRIPDDAVNWTIPATHCSHPK